MEKNWIDEEEGGGLQPEFSEREKELLKDATPFQIKLYGTLDQRTLEAMIIGTLVTDRAADGLTPSTEDADKILDAAIEPEMFETEEFRALFQDVLKYYRDTRKLLSVEDAAIICLNHGQTVNDAAMYRNVLVECKAAAVIRNISVELMIEAIINRYLMKIQDRIYRKAVEERSNPDIGPRKSWENMREACIRDLVDPRGGIIKQQDWFDDYENMLGWLTDMKDNPQKYRGYMCGINAIDIKTKGFRPGQLTVFAGAHGGYKSTTMLNVGYGLWERGYNVLYVSLEMESEIVQLKLWCRATQSVSYTKAYNGEFSHPGDWEKKREAETQLQDPNLPDDQRKIILQRMERYSLVLRGKQEGKGQEDSCQIDKVIETFKTRPNKFKIITCGQSQKMKLSQLERWIQENAIEFKPDVVILDYLDLTSAENPNPKRPDIDLGDTCKMLRALGKQYRFAAITAAQLKRAAWERLRKNGLEQPEKAQLDTDDIQGSHQIGADADNVFMLWRKPGANELMIFTAKARYGEKDTGAGTAVQVQYDTNTVADNIEDMKKQNATVSLSDAYSVGPQANLPKVSVPGAEDLDDFDVVQAPSDLDMNEPESDELFGQKELEAPADDGDPDL